MRFSEHLLLVCGNSAVYLQKVSNSAPALREF